MKIQLTNAFIVVALFQFTISYAHENSTLNFSNLTTPPPNDMCSSAEEIFGGSILECNQDAEIDPDLNCANPSAEATGNCVDPTEPSVWYTFTTPSDMPYNYMTQESSSAVFEIFSSSSDCSNLQYENCSSGALEFELQPSTTYYICVSAGPLEWIVEGPDPASGCDFPLEDLNDNSNDITASNSTSCADPSSDLACEADHVVWYSYTTGCGIADVIVSASSSGEFPAEEVAISVMLGDCSTFASAYDWNGTGYVCNAISGGETIALTDVPPYTDFMIAISSNDNNMGGFNVNVLQEIQGNAPNDECWEAIEVFVGNNSDLDNECSTQDIPFLKCPGEAEASVWYSVDVGPDLVEVSIVVEEVTMQNGTLQIFPECGAPELTHSCAGNAIIGCASGIIMIQVGSGEDEMGEFALNITTTPLISDNVILEADDICSGENANVTAYFENGIVTNFEIAISSESSPYIDGMTGKTINGTSVFKIDDLLTSTSTEPEWAIYDIIPLVGIGNCEVVPYEVAFLVYPPLESVVPEIIDCLPYEISLDADEIVVGGTKPYASYSWEWDGSEISSSNELDLMVEEAGPLMLHIIDDFGCEISVEVDISEIGIIEPYFNFDQFFCIHLQDEVVLPTTSVNGITGSWNMDVLDVDLYPDQEVEVVFTPDANFCSEEIELDLEISAGDSIVFALPSVMCNDIGMFIFPLEDDEGVYGNWEIPSIDLSTITGSFTNTFVSTDLDCYIPYTYTFEVLDNVEVSFDLPIELCKNDQLFTFDNVSLEGLNGSWSIPDFIPNEITGNEFNNTWVSADLCSDNVNVSITLVPSLESNFDLPEMLCDDAGVFLFPTTTDDGTINGTWSIAEVNTMQIQGPVTSVFVPDDECAKGISWTIDVVSTEEPIFDLPENLCALDAAFNLPTISDNNISGSWNVSSIHPLDMQGQQISLLFEPTPGQSCVQNATWELSIEPLQEPDFDLPEILCWSDSEYIFSKTSINGIEGQWTYSTVDVLSNLGQTIANTFTPDAGQCANNYIHQIQILDKANIQLQSLDPTDCEINNGQIEIEGDISDLEFSIDGGAHWTGNNLFEELGSGNFVVLARAIQTPQCFQNLEATLSVLDAPVLSDLVPSDITDCDLNDGSIVIEAVGNDLEYSLDKIDWQSENYFENLGEGFYQIFIREASAHSCVVEGTTMISAFPSTLILNVSSDDVSDCGLEDGFIQIDAVGQNLEYSIDNGLLWGSESLFTDLTFGTYEIQVRSADANNCMDAKVVTLDAPGVPIIEDHNKEEPSDCMPGAGSIEVFTQANNVEFTIDNGLSWTEDGLFQNLEAGQYQIIVRDKDNENCYDEIDVELSSIAEELPEVDYDIQTVSECEALDGTIALDVPMSELEFSIDDGLSWQDDPLFDKLGSGVYTILIRQKSNNNCSNELQVLIPNEDCPCEDLIVDFEVDVPVCFGSEPAAINITSIEGMLDPDLLFYWDSGETTQNITDLTDGVYELVILYDNNCTWTNDFEIELPTPLDFQYDVVDSDCLISENGVVTILNPSGGSGAYMYAVENEQPQSSAVFSDLSEGSYTFSLIDEDNCISEQIIDVESGEEFSFVLPEIETIDLGDSYLLSPNFDVSEIDNFEWTANGEVMASTTIEIEVYPEVNTLYQLEVFYGMCSSFAETNIVVVQPEVEVTEEIDRVFIGNVFSPFAANNNAFFPQSKRDSKVEITRFAIYDRWGELVYEKLNPTANNPEDGWDGTYNDEKVDPAVFIYKLNYKLDGKEEIEAGSVTVVR